MDNGQQTAGSKLETEAQIGLRSRETFARSRGKYNRNANWVNF
ncbi:MAG: hypothetical protein SW833_11860 [Cyanobacteriota bacterium]|nr:hypothetical protein [Cyanobacteriota bacterium]